MKIVCFYPKVTRFYSEATLPGTMRSALSGNIEADCADWRGRMDPAYGQMMHVVTLRLNTLGYHPSVVRVFVRRTHREAKALVQRELRRALVRGAP